jgi:3-hydroxyacyl-CoA dehydrogenase
VHNTLYPVFFHSSHYSTCRLQLFFYFHNISPLTLFLLFRDFGFPLGPFQMADLSGLDVGYKIRKGKQLTEESDEGKSNKSFEVGRGRGTRYSRIGDELFLLGRLGVKNGKGFYQYATKKNAANIGRADKVVEGVIECQTIRRNSLLGTAPHSIAPHVLETAVDEGARERVGELITQRLLYPLINEAFKLLEQGGAVSGRPGDIDIVFLKGSNTAKRSYVVYCVFFSLFSPLLFLAFTSFLSYLHSSSLSHFRLWLAKY